MDLEILQKLGKKAFVQSLKPYNGAIRDSVAIFGLDTEYIPHEGKPSDLICWQLASDTQSALITNKKLTIKNLFQQAKIMTNHKRYKDYIFVTYFALAEIQFFDLNEWLVNEFKGKYRLTQRYGDGNIQIVDLANWYPKRGLKVVATQWGFEKLSKEIDEIATEWGLEEDNNAPIGRIVESIDRKEHSKEELLADSRFRDYALADAVITQRIYTKMRDYFINTFDVDIVSCLTAAGTSAAMFRKTLHKTIDQRDTVLRTMALSCCWGGRMEALYRGEKLNVYEYDAAGHHPFSAMALGVLPTGMDWIRTSNTKRWLKGISGMGKVYFRFPPNEKYPCLPVYHRNSLLFPLEGISYCSVSEAQLAVEKGATIILYSGYYYVKGTNVLSKYLEKLQVVRNASEDPAERDLLKLLSNSIIGKLFQKTIDKDLAKIQKYAEEHEIPIEEAMKLKGVDFGQGEVKVGSCFYPEWYALILGKARATISRQASDHKALVISSDAFVTEENLGEHFSEEGITYNLKASGPLVSYRTRLYRVGEKIAHHAIHSLKASGEVLESFNPIGDGTGVFKYGYFRFMHLREAWRDKKSFGSRVFKPMTVGLGFDYKRKLLDDGTTEAWGSVKEQDEFLGIKPKEKVK